MNVNLDEIENDLNKISPSYCAAKWQTSHLHLNLGMTQSCCKSPLHAVSKESLVSEPMALSNTPELQSDRELMLRGERPAACSFCWQAEDLGSRSDRLFKSSAPWTAPYINEPLNKKMPLVSVPKYIEVSFSNACNLMCSYCSATFSSSWGKEIKENGNYILSNDKIHFDLPKIYKEEENPYVQAFWKWWPQLYSEVKRFRITGGEPLLSPSTFRLLKNIYNNPKPDLALNINSNLAVSENKMTEFINLVNSLTSEKKISYFYLFASIDTWGRQAEFTRKGLNIDLFEKNLRHYLEGCPEGGLSLMITFQALSLPGFGQLIHKIIELKKEYDASRMRPIQISVDPLVEPSHQSLIMLPKEYASYIDDYIESYSELFKKFDMGFSQNQEHKLEYLKTWMLKECDGPESERLRRDFYLFFKKYEKGFSERFVDVFPEYKGLWKEMEI